jgi:hypothetical protein
VTLLTFVRDPDEYAFVGVVVDSQRATYLWPAETNPRFNPDDRPAPTGSSDEEVIAQATTGLGTADVPFDDFTSAEEATTFGQEYLDAQDEPVHPLLFNAADTFDQISEDYPSLSDTDLEGAEADEDPAALDNYVMMLMGPIDPEGENGWVFRAVDGEPREGDEEQYLHLPTLPPVESAQPAEGSAT